VAYLIVALVGLVFGAADQYLGSLRFLVLLGEWPSTASQVSASWLVVPFLAGCTQVRRDRAMRIGLVVTQAALVGYFAMTLSPFEGVPVAAVPRGAVSLVVTNGTWVLGGLIAGPLFGLLGHRWRVQRSWLSAGLVTGTLCLEPFVRSVVGQLHGAPVVWAAEMILGGAVALLFLASRRAGAESTGP
jgi:Family of unknown function (DUF6518)